MANHVILIGRVGKDPFLTETDNGVKKVLFPVATNDGFYDKDGKWVDITNWHNCRAWRSVADRCDKVVCKGDLISIVGMLSTERIDTDGKVIYKMYVDVKEFVVQEKFQKEDY